MNIQQFSGLEILEKVRDGLFPAPSMTATIPMKIVAVTKGAVEFSAVADARLLNPMGGVHGGFAATVLDSAAGCAVHSMLASGESYGTIELNIKMLKAVPQDVELRAKGKIIHISRRLGISEAALKDMRGNLYAHATSTCMILRKNKASNGITANLPQETFTEMAVAG